MAGKVLKARPGYNDRIVLKRDRNGFEVCLQDPELVTYNQSRGEDDSPQPWVDPEVSYSFDTKEQVLAFLTAVIDKALPDDTFASTFDALAKKATEA